MESTFNDNPEVDLADLPLEGAIRQHSTNNSEAPANIESHEFEVLYQDAATIKQLMVERPGIILIHGYGYAKQEDGTVTTNRESYYNQKAALRLIRELHRAAAAEGFSYCPYILVIDGTGHQGDVISTGVAAAEISDQIENQISLKRNAGLWKRVSDYAVVLSESEFMAQNPKYKPAVGTGGEIELLNQFRKARGISETAKALSICRMGHEDRISMFAEARGVGMKTVTAEGILTHFSSLSVMSLIQEFIQEHPEYLESERNFTKAEQKKMKIFRTIDQSGVKIEWLMRFLGPAFKKVLFKASGQKLVEK